MRYLVTSPSVEYPARLYRGDVLFAARPGGDVALFSELPIQLPHRSRSWGSGQGLPVRRPKAVKVLPGERELSWEENKDGFGFELPHCEALAVVRVDW